jgi:hypothetical protein
MEKKVVNLDERMAARREALGEAPEVIVGGKTYTLPPEIPLGLAIFGQSNDLGGILEVMFGADSVKAVLAAGITEKELLTIFAECYGVDLGESSASTAS